jgi:hypothetical protein
MFDYLQPNRKSGTKLMQLSVQLSAHKWHHRAFWYCSPLVITSFQSNLRLTSRQFWAKITFSTKMAAILDFYYFVHFYASNSGGISQE